VAADRFPCRHPDVAFRAVGDDGGMVVLPSRAEVKVLNPVGIKIFSLLDGKHSTDAIAREVVAEFDVSEEQARRELIEFLDVLGANGMLVDEEPVASRESDG
jgi:hypothetical protein